MNNKTLWLFLIILLLPQRSYAEVVIEPLLSQCAPGTEEQVAKRYQFVNDGSVLDRHTGLQWQRCLHGQTFNNQGTASYQDDRCDGDVIEIRSWQHLMQLAEQQYQQDKRWRLPNINELNSTTDNRCLSYNQKPDRIVQLGNRNSVIFISKAVTRTRAENSNIVQRYIELSNSIIPERRVFVRKSTESRSYLTPAFSSYPDDSPLGVFSKSTLAEIRSWYPEYTDTHHDYAIRWVKQYEN